MNTISHHPSRKLLLTWVVYVITGPLWGAIFLWGFAGLYLAGETLNYYDTYFGFFLMWIYLVGMIPAVIAGTIHVALLFACRRYTREHSNIISGIVAGVTVSSILAFWFGFDLQSSIGILAAPCVFACLVSAILTNRFAKAYMEHPIISEEIMAST